MKTTVSVWLTCVCVLHNSGVLSSHSYEVVRPHRHKRSLLQDTQLYPDTVQYELQIQGRNHSIHLEKNWNLTGSSYTETHYTEDGERVTTTPTEEHCYYHGHIAGMPDSAVSVGICSGIRGFVRARQQLYLIEPLGASEEGEHAVYRHSGGRGGGGGGGGGGGHLKSVSSSAQTASQNDQNDLGKESHQQGEAPRFAGLFSSRSWKTKPVSGPERFVELYVVVDKTEYMKYGMKTKPRILEAINHVDKLYRALNMRVLLVGLEMWTQTDFVAVDLNPETTLDHFLLWRQKDLLPRQPHDNAQLVTGVDFEGDTVGLANKFAMCTVNSGGVNQDHHDNPLGLASTIAHEMGHNFGLSHDAPGCECGSAPSSQDCVMADKLRTGKSVFPVLFSGCSVEQLQEFLSRSQPTCLTLPGHRTSILLTSGTSAGRCGNGLTDPGEECDCGTPEECSNPCCDPSTCLLTAGSQCAHGQCCENCQLSAVGSVCRRAVGTCDLPEFCSGTSSLCPQDDFAMDGKACFDQGPGYCHQGHCPTHSHHCWRLFGTGARAGSDVCFDLNRRGEEGANCGRTQAGYTACARQDVKCGSSFCGGGGESITGKRASYNVFTLECKLAVDDDRARRLDMVPPGTKCGPDKVCLDNRCVAVSVYGKSEECAKKCHGNGVCNHKTECHCDPGWAPPYCDIQYADLPQGQIGILAGVCALLSVLLVVAVVITALMCCRKNKDRMDTYSHKRKVHSAAQCRLNPMFNEPKTTKSRPEISQPTLKECTAAALNRPGASLAEPALTKTRPEISQPTLMQSTADENRSGISQPTSKESTVSALNRPGASLTEPVLTKTRPEISQPTLIDSTAADLLTVTVRPCRPAPQPPQKHSSPAATSHTKPSKPSPPTKPKPRFDAVQYTAVRVCAPPVPPPKPQGQTNTHEQTSVHY